MAFKKTFKTAQERVIYIKRVLKPLAKRGDWYDLDDVSGSSYEVGINTDGDEFNMRTADGEELKLSWKGGSINEVWAFALDKVLRDLESEVDAFPTLGVVIKGKTYPLVKS